MNIREMEENGTIDYYLDLKKYIKDFINRNYPLSQEDLRSILENVPTDNVIQRQETYRILNEAMEEVLNNVADKNMQIINGASQGNYTEYSVQDYKKEIFEFQQKMLEKLWEEQHREEQMQFEEEQPTEQENENLQIEQTGEQLVDEVVEQSQEIAIRADEISEAHREINQAEKEFIQKNQQPKQNIEMSIGE